MNLLGADKTGQEGEEVMHSSISTVRTSGTLKQEDFVDLEDSLECTEVLA